MNDVKTGVPLEQFIQALQTQLDRAQNAMALKAENMDLPLTFAVKDISLDLRTHVDVVKSEVRIRPAGPSDQSASTLHLTLTTITRPMIKENAKPLSLDPTQASLNEGDLTDEEQTRLEWAGIHTIDQLQKLSETGKGKEIERVASLPVDRLRQALARASQPQVHRIEPYGISEGLSANDGLPALRVRGKNLARQGAPRVSISGQAVSVLKATDQELIIAPAAHQFAGNLVIEAGPQARAEAAFDLTPHVASLSAAATATTPPVAGGEA
jgi:hypothetical protein